MDFTRGDCQGDIVQRADGAEGLADILSFQ